MSQIKKTSMLRNLDSIPVYINDTNINSDYFNIIKFPEILHSGKNYFLIAGTNKLRHGTPVLVEIKDSLGKSIYTEVSDVLVSGQFRLVIIYIYSDTPIGFATMTIVGEATVDKNDINVPLIWNNKYNVKWQKTVSVNTLIGDTSPAILKTMPHISISEIYDINKEYDIINNISIISGSGIVSGVNGYPSNLYFQNSKYYIGLNYDGFNQNMIGAIVNIPSPNRQNGINPAFSTRIIEVVNSRKATVSPAYVFKNSDNFSIPAVFTSSAYTMSYSVPEQNTGSINKRISYLKVNMSNLDTYSGTVKYVELYKQPGNIFIGKYPVTPIQKMNYGGKFRSITDFTSNWKIYNTSLSNISFDSSSLINSIKVNN